MEATPSPMKLLHSYRNGVEAVQTLSNRPVAKLYLISHPLPASIAEIEISIVSKAGRNTSANLQTKSRSWFDASIIRGNGSWDDGSLDWGDEVRENPEAFRDDIRTLGWDFVETTETGQSSVVSFEVMDAHYGDNFSPFRSCVWAYRSESGDRKETPAQQVGALNLVKEGDRLIIWIRAEVSLSFSQHAPLNNNLKLATDNC